MSTPDTFVTRPIREPPRIPFLDYFSPRMRRTIPTRDNEIERRKNSFARGEERRGERRTLFSIELACSSSSRIRWMEGTRHNRLDQHKAFGKLARVKPISQSKLNTQRNEPADVISSYERKESPFPRLQFSELSPLLSRHSVEYPPPVFSGSVKIR